ncbi:hypothetical protein [Actinoalloteichus sp. GBA129-24]|uniref:hypothetical protein n=1 Tax=Actinoalloteichus sp. GBA129-24 TaxID=1612551 RepID=UPI000950B411|nr:hypothetical protein [Actinoalloteichus sp. GBA129-24]APU20934.1 hypothetical protein UA75_14620 [Actinoalloteichus sp. GBA129-24]APU24183.1 hypothetical protein UA75_31100 [Actinoalloteichus sp. GBA129-24]
MRYRKMIVTHIDGTETRHGGTHHDVTDDVLRVWTRSDYGGERQNMTSYPLVNVRSFRNREDGEPECHAE